MGVDPRRHAKGCQDRGGLASQVARACASGAPRRIEATRSRATASNMTIASNRNCRTTSTSRAYASPLATRRPGCSTGPARQRSRSWRERVDRIVALPTAARHGASGSTEGGRGNSQDVRLSALVVPASARRRHDARVVGLAERVASGWVARSMRRAGVTLGRWSPQSVEKGAARHPAALARALDRSLRVPSVRRCNRR